MDLLLNYFLSKFPKDGLIEDGGEYSLGEYQPTLYQEFQKGIGWGLFGSGRVRFFNPKPMESLSSWKYILDIKTPVDLYKRLIPFASNWHGDIFSFDRSQIASEPRISMLEIGTGALLEVAPNFPKFIDQTLQNGDVLFSEKLYQDWTQKGWFKKAGIIPKGSQCVGFKKPLFIQGENSAKNLEIMDQEVYVDITGQIFSQVALLPSGTPVKKFQIT